MKLMKQTLNAVTYLLFFVLSTAFASDNMSSREAPTYAKASEGRKATADRQDRPNVVLILADDLGYGDVGCYGATKLQTPNIDKLAREGRRFTDAHSASAVCSPSRYGLLTGEYPSRGNGGKGYWGPCDHFQSLMISTDKLTLGQLFKNKGYATAAFGKWHLGFGKGKTDWNKPLRPGPLELGFDYYFGVPKVNSGYPFVYVENDTIVGYDPNDPITFKKPYSKTTTYPPEAGRKTANRVGGAKKAHAIYDDEKTGPLLAANAVKWIGENKGKPFFLYFPTTNIHHPFTPSPQFKGSSQCGLYGDFVQEFDWIVGEVIKCLEKNGLADNTLVIVTSDNGGMFNIVGQNAFKAGHKQNGNLLGFKFGVWEGGHRVPFVAKWPGKIKPNTVSDQLISGVDMLATFAALTGQTVEKKQLADSINVLPALLGEPESPLREILVLSPFKPTHLSLRKGKWVYIPKQGAGGFNGGPGVHAAGGPKCISFVGNVNSDIENGKIKKDVPMGQLYNLENDLRQTKNLYREYPEVVKEMAALLKSYRPKTKRSAPAGARAHNTKKKKNPAAQVPTGDQPALFDFESGDLTGWTMVSGDFGNVVTDRARSRQGAAYHRQGGWHLSTLEASQGISDSCVGELRSEPFTLTLPEVSFLIGGGDTGVYVALCTADGKEVKRATGARSHVMKRVIWNLPERVGQELYLKIVDNNKDGWGHITFDYFRAGATPKAQSPAPVAAPAQNAFGTVTVSHSALTGIGAEKGVMRRDPSDIIKVGDLYYVWYSKGTIYPGYDATLWYAISPDGHDWTEKGMALAKGKAGSWEGESVFTPNILVAESRYWLFYTGVSRKYGKGYNPDSKIGIAVSDSPDGPWDRLASNPALSNSDDPNQFDSHLVDDACLIVREGKYWFYYKGRQLGKSPGQTQMGLAIADHPQGPYVRHEANPVIPGNHEVLVWPQGTGIAAMIGTTGPKEITKSILYAPDGVHFSKTHGVVHGPWAGGAYRPEAFSQSGEGDVPAWGVEIGRAKGFLPCINRFDCTVAP